MDETTPVRKVLEEMISNASFEHLGQFEDQNSWQSLQDGDKELLALLFVMQAELQIKFATDSSTLESARRSLEHATILAPCNSRIWHRKGVALSLSKEELDLNEAYSSFARAFELDPENFKILAAWAQLLTIIATHYSSVLLQEAEEKFLQAFDLMEHNKERIHSSDKAYFYWQWALLWSEIAKQSGEASDLQKAIYKFALAKEHGENQANFYNDYASALLDLSLLINNYQIILEAVELRKRALQTFDELGKSTSEEAIQAMLSLGITYQVLYTRFSEQQAMHDAENYFKQVTGLKPDWMIPWLKWGQLLLSAGKLQRNISYFEEALAKFTLANRCQPEHPEALGKMAEALVFLGTHHEKLELLKQAEERVQQAIRLDPEDSEWWAVYGFCCNELGKYFVEEGYFLKAIDKIEHALSLSPKAPSLWHLIGTSFFSLAEFKDSISLLQKSLRCFEKSQLYNTSKNPNLYNDWGVALMKVAEMTHDRRNVEQAIERFEIAIAIEAGDEPLNLPCDWLYNYGCALDFYGDFTEDETYYEKAIHILTQVLNIDPEHENARYNLALSYSHLGELTGELEAFRQSHYYFQTVLDKNPEDDMAWNDWGLTLVHYALLVQEPTHKEFDKLCHDAEQHFHQALALGNTLAYYNLACLYSIKGNYQDSLYALEKAALSGSLPSLEDMLHDEWLEGLRQTPSFKYFLHQLSQGSGLDEKA